MAGGSSYQQQLPSTVVCFKCGQLGHIASGCTRVRTGPYTTPIGSSTVSRAPECDKQEVKINKQLITRFSFEDDKYCFLDDLHCIFHIFVIMRYFVNIQKEILKFLIYQLKVD
jgi:hypothetical protein